MVSQSRAIKHDRLSRLDELDRNAESDILSSLKADERCVLKHNLQKILREEEIYWLQRSKVTKLLQGDENTKYFQLMANGRHRKTHISQLEQDERIIVGNDNLKKIHH